MSLLRGVLTSAVILLASGCAGGGSPASVPPSARSIDGAVSNITTGTPAPSPTASATPTPAPPPPPTSGTLYVAQTAQVDAYPLGASDTTAPTRSIVPHPNQRYQTIEGIAVNADKTLAIAEMYYPNAGNGSGPRYCRTVVERADASGSPAALGTYLCDPTDTGYAEAIARNTIGGFDVLFVDETTQKFVLRRFSADGAQTPTSMVIDNMGPITLATDRGGHDFLGNSSGRIVFYKAATTDPAVRQSDVTVAGTQPFTVLAVSPNADRTVYVAAGPVGSQNIYALAAGTNTISRTIGPFSNNTVSAMAVDAQGSLYVALNPNAGGAGSFIRVYGSTATGHPAPLRSIFPNPASTYIRGIAIAE